MDIAGFTTTRRDRALLIGDYNSYRASLSRQLVSLRRRLGRATPKNAKYSPKAPVTAQNVAENVEHVKLLLIPAERAWAHAMHIKASHAEDNASKIISGPTRKHIVSKLTKAAAHAKQLVALLSDREGTKASDNDYLEASAYAATLAGSAHFERLVSKRYDEAETQQKAWSSCLVEFSKAHVAYNALQHATHKEVYREAISGTVESSLRYVAHQSKIPRTVALSVVAKRNFPSSETALLETVRKVYPAALAEEIAKADIDAGDVATTDLPQAIDWRGRSAAIVDASIAQALAQAGAAAEKLAAAPSSIKPSALGGLFDPVLVAAQDAVDGVRRAIGELTREGVQESDSRMQDLRVSDLAVSYGIVSWRVGRNRALVSDNDGIDFKTRPGEPARKILARLQTLVTLLDAALQDTASVKSLPGAARDAEFIGQIEAQHSYLRAARLAVIARSYAALGNHKESLALLARAAEVLHGISPAAAAASPSSTTGIKAGTDTALGLPVAQATLAAATARVDTLVLNARGRVELLRLAAQRAAADADAPPIAAALHTWRTVDVTKPEQIVTFPPRLEPVPVKPIFLDIAWNYIDYPGRRTWDEVARSAAPAAASGGKPEGDAAEQEQQGQQGRRGWFGFGR